MNHTYIKYKISIEELLNIITNINVNIFNDFFIIEPDIDFLLIKFNNENSLMSIGIDDDGINSRVNSPIYNMYIVYLELKIMSYIADKLGLHTIQPEGIGEDVAIQQYINSNYDAILNNKKWYVRLLFNPRKAFKKILTKEQYKRLLKF